MSGIWEKFILNQFMRSDIKSNSSKEELKNTLNKFSKEIEKIIDTDETLEILENNIKNWPYPIKEYSIKNLVSEGLRFDVSKSVKFHRRDNKSFLKSDNNEVLIPDQFEKLTEFILKKEYITEKLLTLEFKNIPKKDILECIKSLKNMKVLF